MNLPRNSFVFNRPVVILVIWLDLAYSNIWKLIIWGKNLPTSLQIKTTLEDCVAVSETAKKIIGRTVMFMVSWSCQL